MADSVLLKMDNVTLERMLKSEKKERNMSSFKRREKLWMK